MIGTALELAFVCLIGLGIYGVWVEWRRGLPLSSHDPVDPDEME